MHNININRGKREPKLSLGSKGITDLFVLKNHLHPFRPLSNLSGASANWTEWERVHKIEEEMRYLMNAMFPIE